MAADTAFILYYIIWRVNFKSKNPCHVDTIYNIRNGHFIRKSLNDWTKQGHFAF